jgi:hypothetical protein
MHYGFLVAKAQALNPWTKWGQSQLPFSLSKKKESHYGVRGLYKSLAMVSGDGKRAKRKVEAGVIEESMLSSSCSEIGRLNIARESSGVLCFTRDRRCLVIRGPSNRGIFGSRSMEGEACKGEEDMPGVVGVLDHRFPSCKGVAKGDMTRRSGGRCKGGSSLKETDSKSSGCRMLVANELMVSLSHAERVL